MKNIKRQESNKINLDGRYIFTKSTVETDEQKKLLDKIEQKRTEGKEHKNLVERLNKICKTEKYHEKNIVTDDAKIMIANNLADTSPDNPDLHINKTALGTDDSSPGATDSSLGAEDYRRNTASVSNSGRDVNLTAFYGSTEVSGTFYEHGLFCNGTDQADSGVLLSRVLLDQGNGLAKSTSETLTIDYTINIS